MSSKVLFVEGDTDRCFFERLIKTDNELLALGINVEPKGRVSKIIKNVEELADSTKTKLEESGVLTKLGDDGLTHLGIIADADYEIEYENGQKSDGSFLNRWQQLTKPLVEIGYVIPEPNEEEKYKGSIFSHTDGLPDVGLWLMPNHFDNGSLEDLVLATRITTDKQPAIFSHVESSIGQLRENKLFADHHDSKARAFNWLAWQKKPAHFIGEVINPRQPEKSLINIESQEIQGLINWLKKVFTES